MPAETRDLEPFNAVSVDSAITVRIAAGLPQAVVVTAAGELLPRIATEVLAGVLHIHANGSYHSEGPGPRVLVACRGLRSVRAGGASSVTVDGVQAEALELAVEGASRLSAAGTTQRLSLRAAGASFLGCEALTAGDVSIDVSGASRAELSASRTLVGQVSGAGSVRYRGSATSSVRTSGASHVSAVGAD